MLESPPSPPNRAERMARMLVDLSAGCRSIEGGGGKTRLFSGKTDRGGKHRLTCAIVRNVARHGSPRVMAGQAGSASLALYGPVERAPGPWTPWRARLLPRESATGRGRSGWETEGLPDPLRPPAHWPISAPGPSCAPKARPFCKPWEPNLGRGSSDPQVLHQPGLLGGAVDRRPARRCRCS